MGYRNESDSAEGASIAGTTDSVVVWISPAGTSMANMVEGWALEFRTRFVQSKAWNISNEASVTSHSVSISMRDSSKAEGSP